MRPLGVGILDSAVDALCCMLAPSAAEVQAVEDGGVGEERGVGVDTISGGIVAVENDGVTKEAAGEEEEAGGPVDGVDHRAHEGTYLATPSSSTVPPSPPSIRVPSPRPRRHHLVLRLCGKVLASLAPPQPPPPTADSSFSPAGGVGGGGGSGGVGNAAVPQREGEQEPSAEGSHGEVLAGGGEGAGGKVCVHSGSEGVSGREEVGVEEAERLYSGEAGAGAGGGRRDAVLRRIGAAHSAAAEVVLRGMGDAESASIVAFEEEVRSLLCVYPNFFVCLLFQVDVHVCMCVENLNCC